MSFVDILTLLSALKQYCYLVIFGTQLVMETVAVFQSGQASMSSLLIPPMPVYAVVKKLIGVDSRQ